MQLHILTEKQYNIMYRITIHYTFFEDKIVNKIMTYIKTKMEQNIKQT
jgi:hypothetical protein